MKMVKQRQESIALYKQGNRADLVQQEEEEIAIIERFMPKQLDESEAAAAIDAVVAETGAQSVKDMGKVMAKLKERFAGRHGFRQGGRAGAGSGCRIASSARGAGEGSSLRLDWPFRLRRGLRRMSFTPQFLDELRQRLSLVERHRAQGEADRAAGGRARGSAPSTTRRRRPSPSATRRASSTASAAAPMATSSASSCGARASPFPRRSSAWRGEAGLALPVSSPEERQRAERQATLVTAMETAAAWFEEQLGGIRAAGAPSII